jgi:hypothetical protein
MFLSYIKFKGPEVLSVLDWQHGSNALFWAKRSYETKPNLQILASLGEYLSPMHSDQFYHLLYFHHIAKPVLANGNVYISPLSM